MVEVYLNPGEDPAVVLDVDTAMRDELKSQAKVDEGARTVLFDFCEEKTLPYRKYGLFGRRTGTRSKQGTASDRESSHCPARSHYTSTLTGPASYDTRSICYKFSWHGRTDGYRWEKADHGMSKSGVFDYYSSGIGFPFVDVTRNTADDDDS